MALIYPIIYTKYDVIIRHLYKRIWYAGAGNATSLHPDDYLVTLKPECTSPIQQNLHLAILVNRHIMPSMKKGSWPKPSIESMELLDRHVSRFKTERKKMFGFPCYFVHGNMFAGTFSNTLFARFSVQDRDQLSQEGLGDYFEPVPGHKMIEYRTFSKKLLKNPDALDAWLDKSYSYVSSLRPKKEI